MSKILDRKLEYQFKLLEISKYHNLTTVYHIRHNTRFGPSPITCFFYFHRHLHRLWFTDPLQRLMNLCTSSSSSTSSSSLALPPSPTPSSSSDCNTSATSESAPTRNKTPESDQKQKRVRVSFKSPSTSPLCSTPLLTSSVSHTARKSTLNWFVMRSTG